MKNLFILCLSLFLVSCSNLDINKEEDIRIPLERLPNGCVIEAINYQAVILAKEVITKTVWSKILIVEFKQDGKIVGHAYCVFVTKDGNLFAYDHRGAQKVYTNKFDATNIAIRLHKNVIKAWFE